MNANIKLILEALIKDKGWLLVDNSIDDCKFCGNSISNYCEMNHKDNCIVELARKELTSNQKLIKKYG